MIALHQHVVGAHGAALVALLYLPAAVLAFLLCADVAARLGVPGAEAYLAAYQRSRGTAKLAALLLAVSATVHLAVAPGRAADPSAALFLMDAAALTALAIGAFVLPRWRSMTAALLVANLAAYAAYVVAGREALDDVGLGTKLVEVLALALVAAGSGTWERRHSIR